MQRRPLQHRANNFDFLRHLAAFLVVFGHSQALTGQNYSIFLGFPISVVGVLVFFSISGYLIAESWFNDPNIARYIARRSLRIFPALIACVLLSVAVVGPAFTNLPLGRYLEQQDVWDYLGNIVFRIRYTLPGVFAANPLPLVVNASLWTLPVEYSCYLLLLAVGVGFRSARLAVYSGLAVVIALAAWFLVIVYKGPAIVVWGTNIAQATSMTPYFFVGAAYRIMSWRRPCRLDLAFVFAAILLALEGLGQARLLLVGCWVFVPYIVIAFGACATPVLRDFGRFGDLSYGIYLYGFPVQQAIIQLTHNSLGVAGVALCSTLAASVLAFCSWHGIEKTCLRFKPRADREALPPIAA